MLFPLTHSFILMNAITQKTLENHRISFFSLVLNKNDKRRRRMILKNGLFLFELIKTNEQRVLKCLVK